MLNRNNSPESQPSIDPKIITNEDEIIMSGQFLNDFFDQLTNSPNELEDLLDGLPDVLEISKKRKTIDFPNTGEEYFPEATAPTITNEKEMQTHLQKVEIIKAELKKFKKLIRNKKMDYQAVLAIWEGSLSLQELILGREITLETGMKYQFPHDKWLKKFKWIIKKLKTKPLLEEIWHRCIHLIPTIKSFDEAQAIDFLNHMLITMTEINESKYFNNIFIEYLQVLDRPNILFSRLSTYLDDDKNKPLNKIECHRFQLLFYRLDQLDSEKANRIKELTRPAILEQKNFLLKRLQKPESAQLTKTNEPNASADQVLEKYSQSPKDTISPANKKAKYYPTFFYGPIENKNENKNEKEIVNSWLNTQMGI